MQTTAIPLLDGPIISKGRFLFQAPGNLRWEYTSPIEEGFILTADKFIRWENGKKNATATKPSQDPLGMFLAQQLITWVTFDVDTMSTEYDIALVSKEPLTLALTPKRATVREIMHSLTLAFTRQGTASLVLLEERNGGKTSLAFEQTKINEPIAPMEFTE